MLVLFRQRERINWKDLHDLHEDLLLSLPPFLHFDVLEFVRTLQSLHTEVGEMGRFSRFEFNDTSMSVLPFHLKEKTPLHPRNSLSQVALESGIQRSQVKSTNRILLKSG